MCKQLDSSGMKRLIIAAPVTRYSQSLHSWTTWASLTDQAAWRRAYTCGSVCSSADLLLIVGAIYQSVLRWPARQVGGESCVWIRALFCMVWNPRVSSTKVSALSEPSLHIHNSCLTIKTDENTSKEQAPCLDKCVSISVTISESQ